MTKEPLNIKQILEEWDNKFKTKPRHVDSNGNPVEPFGKGYWDCLECNRFILEEGCICGINGLSEEQKQFLITSLREAMEAVKPKIDYTAHCQECEDEMEIQYEERLDENITNFFKE